MRSSADRFAVAMPPLVAAAAGTRSTRVLWGAHRLSKGRRSHHTGRLRAGLAGIEVVPQSDSQQGVEGHAEALGVGVSLCLEVVRESGGCGHLVSVRYQNDAILTSSFGPPGGLLELRQAHSLRSPPSGGARPAPGRVPPPGSARSALGARAAAPARTPRPARPDPTEGNAAG